MTTPVGNDVSWHIRAQHLGNRWQAWAAVNAVIAALWFVIARHTHGALNAFSAFMFSVFVVALTWALLQMWSWYAYAAELKGGRS